MLPEFQPGQALQPAACCRALALPLPADPTSQDASRPRPRLSTSTLITFAPTLQNAAVRPLAARPRAAAAAKCRHA